MITGYGMYQCPECKGSFAGTHQCSDGSMVSIAELRAYYKHVKFNRLNRLQWLTCWDKLREVIQTKTSWGKNELLTEMDKIERAEVRRCEQEGAK